MKLCNLILSLSNLTLAAGCDVVDDADRDQPDALALDDLDADDADNADDLETVADDLPLADADADAPAGHCIVEATSVPNDIAAVGEEPRVSATPICFPRFADAVFAVTGERIAADVTPDVYEPGEQARSAGGPSEVKYVIGIEYQLIAYGGSSLIVYSGTTCATHTQKLSNLGDFDNRPTSARAFSGCYHSYHYEGTNFIGALDDCFGQCWYIGPALNNRTSSLKWTK